MEWQDLIEILEKYITADCNKTWRLMDWTLSRSKFEKIPLPAYHILIWPYHLFHVYL